MRTSDFDYHLPPELIAQSPAPARAFSRLLVLERSSGRTQKRQFSDLPQLFQPGDLLILNNSRVIRARVRGRKTDSGGAIEVLLYKEYRPNDWWAMLRPAKRVQPGTPLIFGESTAAPVRAVVREKNAEGHCRIEFFSSTNITSLLPTIGEIPLPPYIERNPGEESPLDAERYQTVFARHDGSVAAPTAGLHFSEELLARIESAGVAVKYLTLHVGLGTFAPVKSANIEDHLIHEESFVLPAETASAIEGARRMGGRVIAVGTTTLRALESVAQRNSGRVVPTEGESKLFIYPPFNFQVVDALLTNFHLPKSTLLMLVSAFAAPGLLSGRETVLAAYREAISSGYRFYSYGDAMLIL